MSFVAEITRKRFPASIRLLDQRTRVARRINELVAIYSEALGGNLSPMQTQRVDEAASLQAVSELVREKYLGGGNIAPDDVVRAARVAGLAVKRLGIKPGEKAAPSPLPLRDRLMGAADA
jgi:hypothetical protein